MPKRLRSSVGETAISVPQDLKSHFEPLVVPKYQRDISEIEGKIIAMYAVECPHADPDQIRDIYGFDVSQGLVSGIRDAIAAAYPKTEYARCIVHVVCNTLRYVASKHKKAFANDLKTIYHAPDEAQGNERMEQVRATWE